MYKQSLFSFTIRIIRTATHTTRLGDWFIIAFSVVCVCVLIFFTWRGGSVQKEPYVEITTSDGTFLYQLDKPRTITIDGPLGKTVVVIDTQKINVIQSPGRRQICVNALPISQHGQWLACLPNRVFLRIYGNPSQTQKNSVDALSF